MKTRHGFVSNSSSASFTVSLEKISTRDAIVLLDYPIWASENEKDMWTIEKDISRGLITGFTSMDNCDLSDYIRNNHIDETIFNFGD